MSTPATFGQLIRVSPVPVLFVKTARPYDRARILAAVDPMHAYAKPAGLDADILAMASGIAGAFNGRLHATHVYQLATPFTSGVLMEPVPLPVNLAAKQQERIRREFLELVKRYELPERRRHLRAGNAADGIVALAERIGAGMVVMGAISRSGLKRLFVGSALARQNDFLPFVRDLQRELGVGHVEVIPGLPYDKYMAMMEDGDICIESFHFGGCNTVADSLWIRKPTVTWEGDKWYARIGSQMLRCAGLSQLVCTTEDEYVDRLLSLINDDDERAAVEAKVKAADLDNTVFGTGDAKYFQKALDYLIENHDRLKGDPDPSPIRIERE